MSRKTNNLKKELRRLAESYENRKAFIDARAA